MGEDRKGREPTRREPAGVETTVDGAALRLTLRRADKKNAITSAMYAALADGLARLDDDPDLRVGLLCAQGPDFCAGNDLYDFVAPGETEDAPVTRFLDAIASCRKPLVAAVRGRAIGIGATMLLHCDFVYLDPSAQLRFPFVDLGVVPEAGSTTLLPQLVGRRVAGELLLLASPVRAEQAVGYGLANAVTDDVDDRAARTVEELLAKPPGALSATVRLMRGDPSGLLGRIEAEGLMFQAQLASPEFAEALAKFGQRRDGGT